MIRKVENNVWAYTNEQAVWREKKLGQRSINKKIVNKMEIDSISGGQNDPKNVICSLLRINVKNRNSAKLHFCEKC